MPSQHRTGNAELSANLLFAPAAVANMWNPFLAAAIRGNTQAQNGFGTVASEWQDFVGHRIQEHIALMQRITCCCTPDQVLNAYADFWHKAAEDYGKELTTMTKLMTGVTSQMVAAAQTAAYEASKDLLPAA
jgi:hypothetical protein